MYSFLMEGRKDIWQAAGGFSSASAALGMICGVVVLDCLAGGIAGGLESRYRKFLKLQINKSALGHFSSSQTGWGDWE